MIDNLKVMANELYSKPIAVRIITKGIRVEDVIFVRYSIGFFYKKSSPNSSNKFTILFIFVSLVESLILISFCSEIIKSYNILH